MVENILDPFGNSVVADYEKTIQDMRLKRIDENILQKIKNPNRFLRRGIDFAHIDLDKFLEAVKHKEKVAIMTGIKPTNQFHLGSKMTAEEIIYFQKEFGAKVFYAIADLEGMVDNGLSLDKQAETAIDNVADLLALGLDSKNAYIYRQSQQKSIMNLGYLFSRRITNNHMSNLYGERPLGLYFAAFTQCGDILFPQTEEGGLHKMVLVPVGLDQAPHIFLSRDITSRFPELHFTPPAAIFHKFFRSLDGESKMSKRNSDSMITLSDSPETIARKVSKTLTGGQKTVEEQRKLGGNPNQSVVFELYKYHFVESDEKVGKIYKDYKSGKLLDGEMKKEITEIIISFLEKHQKKKKKLLPKAKKIVLSH